MYDNICQFNKSKILSIVYIMIGYGLLSKYKVTYLRRVMTHYCTSKSISQLDLFVIDIKFYDTNYPDVECSEFMQKRVY